MTRFGAAQPNGVAVQQLEILIRAALFKPASELIGCLLQAASDQADAAYQPKAGQQRKGRVELTVHCIFGSFQLQRDYYYHEGKNEGHYPADAALGLQGDNTPALARLISLEAADENSYEKAQNHLLETGGIGVSARQIQRVVQPVGTAAQDWQQRQSLILEATSQAVPVMYVSADATGVPMRKKELQGRKGKQTDGTAKTRMAYLGCVFTQHKCDAEGHPIRDHESTTYVSSFESIDEFGPLLKREAEDLAEPGTEFNDASGAKLLNPPGERGKASTGKYLISDSDTAGGSDNIDSKSEFWAITPGFSTVGLAQVWFHADAEIENNKKGQNWGTEPLKDAAGAFLLKQTELPINVDIVREAAARGVAKADILNPDKNTAFDDVNPNGGGLDGKWLTMLAGGNYAIWQEGQDVEEQSTLDTPALNLADAVFIDFDSEIVQRNGSVVNEVLFSADNGATFHPIFTYNGALGNRGEVPYFMNHYIAVPEAAKKSAVIFRFSATGGDPDRFQGFWALDNIRVTANKVATAELKINSITIAWSGAAGVKLQKSATLTTPSWQDVAGSDGKSSVTETSAGEKAFYRLIKP